MDIDFELIGVSRELLASDYRSMDGHHSIDVDKDGEYTFCFDNSFSRISAKLVYLDIIIDDEHG